MANWIKTSPWGDYRDPLQNHKFDDQLILNPKNNKLEVYQRNKNILHEARWYYGKHIGSKKLSNIMSFNRKANNKRHIVKEYINNKTTENISTESTDK